MEVKPVPTIANYQVKATNEASEEERRHAKEEKMSFKPGNNLQEEKADSPPDGETRKPSGVSLLVRQIVDSSKLVEMLARKCLPKNPRKVFLQVQPRPSNDSADSKKLNKVL
ncbi:MAG: hypothetical protein HY537_08090 [Deltaproteobacteria bacterium]|nr:hypothetical protein [Deltaproteobacteria bacterium]